MTQPQHYRLTLEDAIASYKLGLITAPGLLYYYLKIKLAPDWRITLHQRKVSEELGISKATFYRALAKLQEDNLIDFESPSGLTVSWVRQESQLCDKSLNLETGSLNLETGSLNLETSTLSKPAHSNGSGDSPNYYQIFTKSLSEAERENFLEFGKKKAAQLPKPPQLTERWIEKNWEELRSQWLAQLSPAQLPAADQERWANDPRRDEWIAEIRIGKPRWIAQGDDSLTRTERKAFAEWAESQNLIWGAES